MWYCIQPSKCKSLSRKGVSNVTIWVFYGPGMKPQTWKKVFVFWKLKLFILWAFVWVRLWKLLNLYSDEFRFLIQRPCDTSRSRSYFQAVNWSLLIVNVLKNIWKIFDFFAKTVKFVILEDVLVICFSTFSYT